MVCKIRRNTFRVSNRLRCLLVVWAVTVTVTLAITVPIGLCAGSMFMDQGVGEIGVNGRRIRECNATLQLDVAGCFCLLCSSTGRCHQLKYGLVLRDQERNATLSNEWVWGCHCSDCENPVIDGPMRCTVDDANNDTLEGYGREPSYKVGVITLVVATVLVVQSCGIAGTIYGVINCDA